MMPALATQVPTAGRRAPLARLIVNPDQTAGAPPYALTDQTGTVQRYVDPVPEIDLDPYIGQIVSVRNDTGQTLLASQLELPRQPLYPMVGESSAYAPNPISRPYARPSQPYGVEQVQYVDNDDSSVQLLPDGTVMAGGMPPQGQIPMMGEQYPGGYGSPMMPGEMCGPNCDPQFADPMQCGPGCMTPGAPIMAPYPQMGGYPADMGCPAPCAPAPQPRPQISGDVEFMFYRVNINDRAVGKLSETYEFSPRFILNFRNVGALDGRVRYWHYDRDTNINGGGDIRLEFDVLDIEAVHYLEGRRANVALAAGVRLADVQLRDAAGEGSGNDMIGLTMAADGLTPVITMQGGYCGWVYGGRLSLLTGDWGGDDNSVFVNGRFSDDNILVTELYAGIELARRCGNATVRGRALFEMQNWRSDVLAQNAGVESIGFIGPALQIGADF
jgi:hypothetical protein